MMKINILGLAVRRISGKSFKAEATSPQAPGMGPYVNKEGVLCYTPMLFVINENEQEKAWWNKPIDLVVLYLSRRPVVLALRLLSQVRSTQEASETGSSRAA